MTRKTNNVAELADLMIEVHRSCTMGNADFCASLISCATSIAARDGLTNELVLKMVVESATNSLAVVRAHEQLEARNAYTEEEVADIKLQQNIAKWRHCVRHLPADDPRHIVAANALKKHAQAQH